MIVSETSGRTANVKRNIIYGMVQIAVSRVFPFCIRTIVIYRFGIEYLGLTGVFTSVLSTLSLMELGFGTAIVYSMYKPVAEGDTGLICAYLKYYRKIYRFIGMAILMVGLCLMPFLRNLVHDPVLPGGLDLYVCYLIFLGNAVIGYLLYGYITAIPTAYQRRDILSRIDMDCSLFGSAIKVFILLSSNSFYLYLICMPLITIVNNLVVLYVVRKMYPEISLQGELTSEQKLDLKKKVSGILVNKLTNVSRNSIDYLCISAFIGLAATGIYNNYFLVMSSILSTAVMVCTSMMASVGNSIATESRQKNYSDMRLFDFMFMPIAGWSMVCMLCLYQPFMLTWVGKEKMFDISIVLELCLYYYILLAGAIRWVYHEGAGLWWECRYIMLGEAIANIVLNIILCRLLGVAGIVLATILSAFATNCILCPELIFRKYFKNGKLHEYWMDHFQYATTTALIGGACWLTCHMLLPMTMVVEREITNCIICLVGRLLACTIITMGILWIVWYRSERYNNAIKWIGKFKHVCFPLSCLIFFFI